MSLSLTLILTPPAHHTSSTYLTPPTVPRMCVKYVLAVYVKDELTLPTYWPCVTDFVVCISTTGSKVYEGMTMRPTYWPMCENLV